MRYQWYIPCSIFLLILKENEIYTIKKKEKEKK